MRNPETKPGSAGAANPDWTNLATIEELQLANRVMECMHLSDNSCPEKARQWRAEADRVSQELRERRTNPNPNI